MKALMTPQSRLGKSMVNVATGAMLQILTLVLNFVVRIVFVRVIGYSYLGISALFANILTVLSVADLGFGTSISISLYAALKKGDENHIAGIITYYKRIYLIIAGIVFAAGCIICPFIGYIVNTETPIDFLWLYFLIYLINLVSTYLISYRHAIIKADQKNGVINTIHSLIIIAKSVVELLVVAILPHFFGPQVAYLTYLVIMVLATYGNEIWCAGVAKKMYPYAFKRAVIPDEEKKEIKANVRSLLLYKVCKVVNTSVDSILISILVSTTILGKYSNYTLIIGILMGFGCLISRNSIASLGNFVLSESKEKQINLFYLISFVHVLVAAFFVVNYVGILEPFFALSFGTDSTLSIVVLVFTAIHIAFDLNYQVNELFRETTKLFRKIPYISLINLSLNIIFSIVFGIFFGLEGIIGGTLLAYFLTSFWFESFALFKYYFKTSSKMRWLKLSYAFVSISAFAILCYFINSKVAVDSLFSKVIFSILISIVLSICCVFSFAWFKEFKTVFAYGKRIIVPLVKKIRNIIKKPLAQKIILITGLLAFLGLIIPRDLFGFEIDKFIFVTITVLFACLLNERYFLCYFFFLIPFHSGLPTGYIYPVFLVLFILRNLKFFKDWRRIVNYFAIPFIIFALELIMSAVYGKMTPLSDALMLFSVLGMFSFIIYNRQHKDLRALNFFVFGVATVGTILLVRWLLISKYMAAHTIVADMTFVKMMTKFRFGDTAKFLEWTELWCQIKYPYKTSMYLGDNSNYIGLIMMAGIMLGSYQLVQKEKLIVKIGIVLSLIICLLCGIYTGSKTFFICLGLYLIYFIVMLYAVNKIMPLTALITLLVLGLAITLVCIFVPYINRNIVQRLSDDSLRFELIREYSNFIFSDPLIAIFGCGATRLGALVGFDLPPHNAFVQIIGGYGLFGFSIIIAGLVLTIWKGRPKLMLFYDDMLLVLSPLFVYFIYTMTSQIFMPANVLIYGLPIFYLYVCRNNIISEKYALELNDQPIVYNESPVVGGNKMINLFKKVVRKLDYYFFYYLSDEKYIKHQFKLRVGYKPDLENPKTFCEKLQWLKLHDRKNVYTDMVDKRLAKEFATKRGLKVIPTLGFYKSFKEIDFDKLPDKFILKTTHTSGGFVVCQDKKSFDYDAANYALRKSLRKNYYKSAREWPYKNVERGIFAEPLIETLGKPESVEYKVTCFNGKVEFVTVCRGIAHSKLSFRKNDFYDKDFNLLPFVTEYYENSNMKNEKPAFFEKMLEQAEKIAKDTYCLRVDFYDIDGEPVFGEATFFTWAGFIKFIPEEYDRILGERLKLPIDKQQEKQND